MRVPKPRKLPSGTWFIQLRLGGQSIPVSARTERECVRMAQLRKAEYQAGIRSAPKRSAPTLTEAIDSYISKRDAVLSPSTIRGYRIIQRTRFQPLMHRPIDSIQPGEWQAAVNDEAKTVAPKTVKSAWGLMVSVIRDATGQSAPIVRLPQQIPHEKKFLQPEQIKTFIAAVHGTKVEIPALLGLSSLRQSEILALTWDNIDFKQRKIKIRGAAVRDDQNRLVTRQQNKTLGSTRDVPIFIDELYSALLASRSDGSEQVVQISHVTLFKNINRICRENGLPEIGVHGLRHSFASLAYHLGIPALVTMQIGGWSDKNTMLQIYTHLAESDKALGADKLSEFFRNE